MRKRDPRRRPPYARIGAIALVVLAAACYVGFTKSIPFRHHYTIKAVFKTANNIRRASPVRIAGVEVGRVTSVSSSPRDGGSAVVTMRISDKGRPVHEDATAAIRPRILLEGNFFVDLDPGSPSSPEIPDGGTIPVNQTRTPVQLDQILTALQSDTRDSLKIVLDQYSRALASGGAKAFNRSIPYWAPAYRDTAIVDDALLGRNEHDLSGYVRGAGATAAALDRNSVALKSLITDFNTTAAALARESAPLQAAVAELPRTLRAGRPALAALDRAFPPLRAFARELDPGVRSSGPTLDVSIPFVRQLRRLVSRPELRGLTADLRPAVPALARLARASVPLLVQARRGAGCQNSVILPWSHDRIQDPDFPAKGQVFEEAPKPLPGLAGESRTGDANGSWFRVLSAGGKNLVTLSPGLFATTPFPIMGANPPKSERPPLRSDVPCETQQTPDLRTVAGPPPEQHQVDTSAPAFQARYAKALAAAVAWLKSDLEQEGLADVLKVSPVEATPGLLDQIATQAKAQDAPRDAQIKAAGG